MCGICGVLELRSGHGASIPLLGDMLQIIRHRGPDDEGIYVDGAVGLGSRRLSIIDVPGGKQPITNEDGTVIVVFNGEIYNYRELRSRLLRQGHTFATESDTEVIVHLYEDLGNDCVNDLNGMFAFALWDKRNKRILLARDRLGIKPLYYTVADNTLVFGSEIKSILRHPQVQARLDPAALGNYLSLRYVPAPQTMFAGIHALPPGHILSFGQEHLSIRSYWDLSFTAQEPCATEEDCAERLESLLRESVRSQLVSDVPFGAFLSGGLDSSTIVALMSQYLDQPVKTFAVGYEGPDEAYSELPYARLVARQYQTEHHESIVRAQDLIDLAQTVVWHLDQPIADPAVLTNYKVAELAARHVKMVLSGEGGDELFAGYARYSAERISSVARRVPSPVRSLTLAGAARLPGLRRPKIALLALSQPDEVTRLVNWFPLFDFQRKANLLSDGFRAELDESSANLVFAEQLGRTDATDALGRMLYVDTKLWLPDDLLARGDKTSMANSLEARVPLLDHRLVEFAAGLPAHFKIRRLTRKYLLRKVATPWLPPEVLKRKKQGFPTPMSLWFRGEARDFLRDHLSPEIIRRRGLFAPSFVETLLEEHDSGFADHGNLLWGLVSVELWHRAFLDENMASGQPAWDEYSARGNNQMTDNVRGRV